MSPWQINFVLRRLVFVDPQQGTRFVSPFWRLQFCDGFYIFGKICGYVGHVIIYVISL
jgi:hypothetical protein